MAHFRQIRPEDIKQNDCEGFWEMLYEAAYRAELPLPKRRYTHGRGNKYCSAWDGIYLPNTSSFWCGIIYHDNYRDCIVFVPAIKNLSRYPYNKTIASKVMSVNYRVDLPQKGLYVPDNPRRHPECKNYAVFKTNLAEAFANHNSFYSLECGECQCEWLSVFMRKAWADIKEFREYGTLQLVNTI